MAEGSEEEDGQGAIQRRGRDPEKVKKQTTPKRKNIISITSTRQRKSPAADNFLRRS